MEKPYFCNECTTVRGCIRKEGVVEIPEMFMTLFHFKHSRHLRIHKSAVPPHLQKSAVPLHLQKSAVPRAWLSSRIESYSFVFVVVVVVVVHIKVYIH